MTKTEEIMELVEYYRLSGVFSDRCKVRSALKAVIEELAAENEKLHELRHSREDTISDLKDKIEELVADTETIRAKERERCAKVIEEELYPRPRSGYQIQYNAGIQELANKIRSLE